MLLLHQVRLRLLAAVLAVLAGATPCLAAPAGLTLAPAERNAMVQALDPAAAALSDAALWDSVIGLAAVETGQRIRPSEVDAFWAIQPASRDLEAELAQARSEGLLGPWLQSLSPDYGPYRALVLARRRYLAIAQAGGWPTLPAGPSLKEKDRSPQVALLRTRLAAEGYGEPRAQPSETFGPGLRRRLAEFQRRHDLPDDGALGPQTRAALNVPVQDRLAQIEANLERWRWMPRTLPARRVEVDVAGAQATLYPGDGSALEMRAVVGDPGHRTPMFASRLEAVVFNPPWNVPTSIAASELRPHEARDPGYLARNGFTTVDGHLQQQPGPKNALGQLKFDLPSPFGVYLHDTPGKAAFLARNRARSHGCMRLEKPRDLAIALLGRQGWSAERVDAAIADGATLRVDLAQPTPLYVVYRTAVADTAGVVDFRRDPYGWDRKLIAALALVPPRPAVVAAAETECTPPA